MRSTPLNSKVCSTWAWAAEKLIKAKNNERAGARRVIMVTRNEGWRCFATSGVGFLVKAT